MADSSLTPWKQSQRPPIHEIPAGKFAVYVIWTRAEIRSEYTLSLPGSIPTHGMLECYVGYGQGKRPWEHFDNKRERARNPHRTRVLDKEKSNGRDPLITIAFLTDTKQQATEVEILLEKIIGRVDLGTGPLTNKKDCGLGGRPGPDLIAHLSEKSKQWSETPQGRDQIMRANAASNTPEARAKRSEKRKAWCNTPEGEEVWKRGLAKAHGPEARAKGSEAKKKFAQTPKGKEQIQRQADLNRKITPEQAEVIRQRHANGETYKAIAADYDVTGGTISGVVNRKNGY